MRRTLLIPALLDHHWPLLRWAFVSEQWEPVILENRAGEPKVLAALPFAGLPGQV